MGPMRAACLFARELSAALIDCVGRVARVQVDLYGSLALTGKGHATDRAVLLGLEGNEPSAINPAAIESTVAAIRVAQRIDIAGAHAIAFDEPRDLIFHRDQMFPPGAVTQHPNGLRLTAFDASGAVLVQRTFFSIGGGFIAEDGESDHAAGKLDSVPYPFSSAAELLEISRAHSLSIDRVMLANECARIATRRRPAGRRRKSPNSASGPASNASGKPCRPAWSAASPRKAFFQAAWRCAAARIAWRSGCAR